MKRVPARLRRLSAALLITSAALSGCKSKGADPAPAPVVTASAPAAAAREPAAPADPHFIAPPAVTSLPPDRLLPSRPACKVEIRGDLTRTVVGTFVPSQPGDLKTDVSAASDYWLSDEDLRTELGRTAAVFATDAEAKRKLDTHMAADPRLMVLRLSCLTAEGGVILMTPERAHYRDVPFTPGTYAISAGDMASAGPREFVAQTVRNGPLDYFHALQGTLSLTRFDATGVAGSFSLSAQSADSNARIEVKGTFDLPCDPLGASKCESLRALHPKTP